MMSACLPPSFLAISGSFERLPFPTVMSCGTEKLNVSIYNLSFPNFCISFHFHVYNFTLFAFYFACSYIPFFNLTFLDVLACFLGKYPVYCSIDNLIQFNLICLRHKCCSILIRDELNKCTK